MLALRLLVTATLTAWAVTTYTPEVTKQVYGTAPTGEKEHLRTDCVISHPLTSSPSVHRFIFLRSAALTSTLFYISDISQFKISATWKLHVVTSLIGTDQNIHRH